MTATEQLWFLVAIGGFLLFMEGAISFVARRLIKRISEDNLKVVVGIVIFILALIYLINLPPTT